MIILIKPEIKDFITRSHNAGIPDEVLDLTLAYIRFCYKERIEINFNKIIPSRKDILNLSSLSIQEKEYLTTLNQNLREYQLVPENYLELYFWYAYNLINGKLPVIFSVTNLAGIFDLSFQGLHFLASSSNKCYTTFSIPKSSGGSREINVPVPKLMEIQRWILDNILHKIPLSESNTAFVKGGSIIKNAVPHVGANVVINMDLESFFPSIKFERVLGLFLEIGYLYPVALMLSKLACYKGVLPQGAPTSPMIANLICRRLDLRIGKVATKLGFTYTRYADDITLSGKSVADNIINMTSKIITSEGFTVSAKKTRVIRRSASQKVTGLIVNVKPNVPKEYYRKLRAIIHNCKTQGVQTQNFESEEAIFKQRMYGHAYYVRSVNPKLGDNLLKSLAEVDWNS